MEEQILFSIKLSFQVAVVSTLLVTILGIFLAYMLSTRQFKGKTFCEILITLPLILPPTVVGYYLILIFGKNGIIGNWIFSITNWSVMFTWWGAVLASLVVSLPLMVKTVEAAISSVDKTMVQTAYILGYSEFETLIKVVFPLARSGIIAGIVLSFARSMGEFGATLMLAGNIPGRTSTMPLTIYSLVSSGEWEKAHLLVIILTLSSTLFLLLTYNLSRPRKKWRLFRRKD